MSTTLPRADRRRNRRRQRFARFWRANEAKVHDQISPAKDAVLTDLPDEIVEIGPGCGSNFGHYPSNARVIAYEPNPAFAEDLHAAAATHGLQLDLRDDLLTDRLPEASVDVVVSTLVLCSVPDTPAMLAEIHRVLRPGGRLLFVEHVKAEPPHWRAAYQRLVRRPWRALGDGCDPCARTDRHLAASDFELVDTELGPLGTNLDPTNLCFWGSAVRTA